MPKSHDTVAPRNGAQRPPKRAVRAALAAALAAVALAPLAQTVYETKDKAGPVFSDKPAPSASVVDVGTPNVIAMPPTAPAPAAPVQAGPAYRSFVIDVPTGQGTVHSNSGAFDVRARLSPALRSGDRILVNLDGTVLKTPFRSPSLRVSDADWRAAANADNALHTVQLAVVDARGTVLIETPPAAFYVQRATVSKQQRAR